MRAEDAGVQAGELVVVTGPPGAGKSTLARELAQALEPSALIRGDDFFAFLERGRIAPWTPEAHAQNQVVLDAAATRHMHAQFRDAAIHARHVVPTGLDLPGAVRWVLEAIAAAATVVQVEPVADNPGRASVDVGDNGRP